MLLLIGLQASLTALYFVTAPFQMSDSLWIILSLNLFALAYLYKRYQVTHNPRSRHHRYARLAFTVTLIALEFFIFFSPNPVSPDGVLGLINDAEVLVTGILLGILWRHEILNHSK
jgi:hypothetical protein